MNDYITKGGRVQVRWTAPEAMYYRQYSTASDVWSYGCLLYEIWSLGRMPFRDSTNAEVRLKMRMVGPICKDCWTVRHWGMIFDHIVVFSYLSGVELHTTRALQ